MYMMEILSFYCPTTLAVFTLMFTTIYLFGYFTFFKKWSFNRPEASSCLISLAHGTPAVCLATYATTTTIMLNSKTQLITCSSPNTDLENMVLDYSIAYFLVDLFHYLLFIPSDIIFIAHHLATLYVFITCRYVIGYGASPILVLLVIAELTSPCQNTWSLARYRKADVAAAARLCEFLSPLFYGFYSIARGIIAPIFVYKMGLFYVRGEAYGLITGWAWVSWMLVIVVANLASILWVLNLWLDFYRERNKQVVKKSN